MTSLSASLFVGADGSVVVGHKNIGLGTVFDVPEEYVLYKHGPYSFVVQSEIEEMKSYAGVSSDEVASGYGLSLSPGKNAGFIREKAQLSPATEL